MTSVIADRSRSRRRARSEDSGPGSIAVPSFAVTPAHIPQTSRVLGCYRRIVRVRVIGNDVDQAAPVPPRPMPSPEAGDRLAPGNGGFSSSARVAPAVSSLRLSHPDEPVARAGTPRQAPHPGIGTDRMSRDHSSGTKGPQRKARHRSAPPDAVREDGRYLGSWKPKSLTLAGRHAALNAALWW